MGGGGANLDDTPSTNTGDRVDIPDSIDNTATSSTLAPDTVAPDTVVPDTVVPDTVVPDTSIANNHTQISPEQKLEDKSEDKSALNSQGHGKPLTPLESPLTPLEDSQSTNTPNLSAIVGDGDLTTDTVFADSYRTATALAKALGTNNAAISRNITHKTKDKAIAWCINNGYKPYYYNSGLKVFVKA